MLVKPSAQWNEEGLKILVHLIERPEKVLRSEDNRNFVHWFLAQTSVRPHADLIVDNFHEWCWVMASPWARPLRNYIAPLGPSLESAATAWSDDPLPGDDGNSTGQDVGEISYNRLD